jgi:hypothetical protein
MAYAAMPMAIAGRRERSYVRNYIEECFELSPSHITLQPQIHSAKEMGLACKHSHRVSHMDSVSCDAHGG